MEKQPSKNSPGDIKHMTARHVFIFVTQYFVQRTASTTLTTIRYFVAGWSVCIASLPAFAIDFETIPSIGTPVDQMQISSQFWFSDGVRFRLEEGGFPFLAKRGSPRTAFNAPNGNDQPDVSAGNYFLTNSKSVASGASTLMMEFASPVKSVSGVILDIDATDVWTVEIWGGGVLLDSSLHTNSDPDAGDGAATPWSFERATADVDFVRMVYSGNSSLGVGWDNFLFSPVILPTAPVSNTIDFESIPGLLGPADRLEISTQYSESDGISFRLGDGTFPELAFVGAPRTSFEGPPNDLTPDTPASEDISFIGNVFLTDDGLFTNNSIPLIVEYDPPTREASGVILDIDNNETFSIQAKDSQGLVIHEITIVDGDVDTGDGIATEWSISLNDDIYSISFSGSKPSGGFGLGFDKFNARRSLQSENIPFVPLHFYVAFGLLITLIASRNIYKM